MRRALIVLGLAVGVAFAAPALGQPAPSPEQPERDLDRRLERERLDRAPAAPVVDDDPIPTPPKSTMRQPEILHEKPSGFWTSNVPARGGAYRYRLMGIGLCVLALTAFFTIRFLRKVSRARTATP